MSKNKKNKRRVLAVSCIFAALIVAGSTFAWFTSKDEVTNRLTATADYGVSIAEDFTPPENWIPGQKIEKNVGVVNTGNVDALVRTWLTGEMRVTSEIRNTEKFSGTDFTKLTTTSRYDSSATATIAGLTDVTDAKLKELGLTYSYTNGGNTYYLRELDKEHRYNNPTITTANNQAVGNNAYTEVEALQAGGVLAYTNNAAARFIFTPNQTLNFTNAAGTQIYLEKGTPYTIVLSSGATDITQATSTITAKDVEMLSKYCGDNLATDTFKPITSGLYIFKRNVDLDSTDDYEFTGYYYVAKKTSDTGAEGKFFALQYANDDSQRSSVAIEDAKYKYTDANNDGIYIFSPSKTTTADADSVALYTAKQEVVENADLKWNYFAKDTTYKEYTKVGEPTYYVDSANKVYDSLNDLKKGVESAKTFNSLGTDSFVADSNKTLTDVPLLVVAKDDIIINIALADTVGIDAEQWTVISTAGTPNDYKFYYNNDVEEGATTSKLVDSVELDNSVTQNAYVAFDFDLNVNMDSVQVTYDDNGMEDISAAKSSWAQINKTGTAATYDSGSSEIKSITWSTSDS